MIVLSNHATRDIRWRCAQLGADAVFDKSTELDELVDYCVSVRTQH
jgi:DNA-binding NarL/FixJ family response regulator